MRAQRSPIVAVVLYYFLFSLSLTCSAQQAWTGVLNSSRAGNWLNAGISSGIPSSSWTQCGATLAPGSYSGSSISTSLAACGTNTFYLLGPGNFTISGPINFPTKGHVVLRGSGANSTFLSVTGSGTTCQLSSALICIQSSDGTYTNQPPPIVYGIKSGYAQGSSSLTLSGTSSISATNPTILFIEQCETGYSTSSVTAPCTGSSVDNGNLFLCSDEYETNPTGCSSDGPGNESTHRGHLEMTVATSVNSGTGVVGIADPIVYPDWASGLTPRVWIAQPIVDVGVESMAIDLSSNVVAQGIEFFNAYQWWVSDVKLTNMNVWAINAFQALHGIVQNSYFYHSTGSDSYGIRCEMCGQNLFVNNIFTQVFAPIVLDGASSADVVAYNYIMNDNYQSDFMRGSAFEHDVNAFELYEGNVTNQIDNDGNHGTANMITRFRNFSLGWDSCANGQCGSTTAKDSSTNAFSDAFGSRYENNVANVAGEPGYHTTYKGMSGNYTVFLVGGGNGGVSPAVPSDPLSASTSLFWGNYDTVTATVRWCGNSSDTGWSSTCGSTSEVPTGASTYPNSVPTLGDTAAGMGALPASFFLSSPPSWWGSAPWPAIGPDVSGGNVGRCSGTLNTSGQYAGMPATSSSQCTGTSLATGWGGHVNAIPAMNCYLNVMGGAPDGTGSVLAFDPAACYGNSAQTPTPPSGLTAQVQP